MDDEATNVVGGALGILRMMSLNIQLSTGEHGWMTRYRSGTTMSELLESREYCSWYADICHMTTYRLSFLRVTGPGRVDYGYYAEGRAILWKGYRGDKGGGCISGGQDIEHGLSL